MISKPKNTPGGTHDSGHICGRGWPCWTSMGGTALGPEGVRCPSVGECQGWKAEWDRRFPEGRPGKGVAFEM